MCVISDLKNEKTFENVFHPLEEISIPLNYAWRTTKNLSFVCGDDGYRHAFARVRAFMLQCSGLSETCLLKTFALELFA